MRRRVGFGTKSQEYSREEGWGVYWWGWGGVSLSLLIRDSELEAHTHAQRKEASGCCFLGQEGKEFSGPDERVHGCLLSVIH